MLAASALLLLLFLEGAAMTADRAALVEKVARALCAASYSHIELSTDPFEPDRDHWEMLATAAIDLLRAEVLEEAARVALRRTELQDDQEMAVGEDIAAAIRALKDKA